MKRVVSVLLVAVALLPHGANADSYAPFEDRIEIAPGGRYYIVLTNAYLRGAKFSLVRRAKGLPPMTARTENRDGWIAVSPGDDVLCTGYLDPMPLRTLVSESGKGFVGVEAWGPSFNESIFTVVAADGGIRHRRTLDDLMDRATSNRYMHSMSSLHWFRGAWLDDERGEVVLVATDGEMRVVARDTGRIRDGRPADLVRGLTLPSEAAGALALELLAEGRIEDGRDTAVRLVRDAAAPIGLRLRAAVLLAVLGDDSGRDVVRRALAKPGKLPERDLEHAVVHLPEVLGRDALPIIERLVCPEEICTEEVCAVAARAEAAAGIACEKLGADAVPVLVRLLVTENSWWAADTLGKLGDARALPQLLRAVAGAGNSLASVSLESAARIGGRGIAPDLAGILEDGTAVDAKIADYFRTRRHLPAVPPLIRALRRSAMDDHGRATIVRALEFQTGQGLGPDPDRWKAWWKKR